MATVTCQAQAADFCGAEMTFFAGKRLPQSMGFMCLYCSTNGSIPMALVDFTSLPTQHSAHLDVPLHP